MYKNNHNNNPTITIILWFVGFQRVIIIFIRNDLSVRKKKK